MAENKGDKKQDEVRPIIVKKIKKGGGGHHGGAWKVAYADFVTAMMAFFLLLWLLNVTTDEQKMGIADFFDPNPKIAESKSGAGGIMGGLTVSPDGAMVRDTQPITPQQQSDPALRPGADPSEIAEEKLREEIRKREDESFKQAEAEIQKAIQASPELQELSKNIMMDITPEGLRIQIVDQDGNPMFPSGSAEMYDKTKNLMAQVAKVIEKMPNELSIRGHTDSVPYGSRTSYGNWELSAERANASRRVLESAGLPAKRLNNVVGKSDTDHQFPDKPADARNRRVSIVLLRQEMTTQVGANRSTNAVKAQVRDRLYNKSSGAVDFP
jgi:chemotaxis protein MotB